MANENPENLPRQNRQESSLTISKDQADVIVAISEVNKLTPFPLGEGDLTDWAADILRLAPGVEPGRLDFLFDLYKTEQLVWDRNKGIQNIFTGLKFIGKNEKGYYLRKRVW